MHARRELAAVFAACFLCANSFEFHPRLLGLDTLYAPLHFQLPGHMLSASHGGHKRPCSPVNASAFEAASRSQMWEEIYFFRTFLELGALDGQLYSNTWALEHLLGWSGILIEPGTENFASLIRNRPDNVLINAAICGVPQVVHFTEFSGVGGIVEFMSDEFMRRWWPLINRTNLTSVPKMACIPLSSILSAFGVRRIDFLSVDVEGGELQVLETINFKEVAVYVVTVEADQTNIPKEEAIRALLKKNNFHHVGREMSNDWFVNLGLASGGAAA